jgi:hypothetical protein
MRSRLFETHTQYAARIGVDPRTVIRLWQLGSIVAQAQLTDGTPLFDGSTFGRDYQLCVPLMRTSSPGYQRMMEEVNSRGK